MRTRVEQRQVAAVERLAELIRESECTVALTGAGVSVPSVLKLEGEVDEELSAVLTALA